MSRRKIWAAAFILLVLTVLPYVLAVDRTGQAVFSGFLFNPNDSNSYLAKMLQGYQGAWRFVLPFTAEPGNGAYLFLFYLALGHLARLLHLPLVLVFHLARALAGVLLVFQLAAFFSRIFADQKRLAWAALLLAELGSGLGWMVVLSGSYTSDLWVAEAYPFLSTYANPHFPLGLALLLMAMLRLLRQPGPRLRLELFLIGLLLSVVMPFGVVVLAVVTGLWFLWAMLDARKFLFSQFFSLACLFLGGGAFLLYQYLVTLSDPALTGWNAQNITTSPPLWDVLVAFSPLLLLGLAALPHLWRQRHVPAARLLLTWFATGLLLVYLPFSLQRRFMLGFYIPVAAAGVMGMTRLARRVSAFNRLYAAVFLLSILTNAGLLYASWLNIEKRNPLMYLSAGEKAALDWISTQTAPRSIVLASPQIGQFLPAHTARRVIYGHPFETVNAIEEQHAVEEFFTSQSESAARAFLDQRRVDYIFYGPREQILGSPPVLAELPPVFNQAGVTVYRVEPAP